MKFELLLAKRYLSAQRRHSVLTVCSIVIAVALLTALSTCFSTLRGVFRDAAFDEAPYHVLLYDVTEAQCRQIEKMNHIGSCTFVPSDDGRTGDGLILFDSYIGSLVNYISEMNRSLNRKERYTMNLELVYLDLIDEDSRVDTVMTYTVFVIFLMLFALGMRMLIDTAFEVSSKERERQFGVLRSIGATPRQVLKIQSFEGILLSLIAVPLGCLAGIGTAYLIFRAVLSTGIASYYLEAEKIPQIVRVHLSPLLIACSAVIGIMWVFFSAYGTGMRNVKKSPVQMITSRAGGVKRVRDHRLSGLLFGWTGRLAARNARREKKRFVITVLALTVSLTMFAGVSSVMDAVMNKISEEENIGLGRRSDLDFSVHENPLAKTEAAWEEQMRTRREQSYREANAPEHPTAYYKGVQELKQSGYFKDLLWTVSPNLGQGYCESSDGHHQSVFVYYMSETAYDCFFGELAPMSYAELEKNGGGLLAGDEPEIIPVKDGAVTLTFECMRQVNDMTEEKYDALIKDVPKSERWRPEYPRQEVLHGADGEPEEYFYWTTEETTVTLPVAQVVTMPFDPKKMDFVFGNIQLIFPESVFRERDWQKFDDFNFGVYISCNLKDPEQYQEALSFLKNSTDITYNNISDNFTYIQRIKKTTSSWSVGLNAVTVMIALIAIVNLINIVSTGILNRKREFAAMQCSGMTRGQMYRLVVIECLQFTLFAAIASTILCLLIIRGTTWFLVGMTIEASPGDVDLGVSYLTPVIRIWIAAIAAFAVTLLASVIPLHRMRREPLAEQIRAVE